MQVIVKGSESVVKLQKRERDILTNAAELLKMLGKHMDGEVSESAVKSAVGIDAVVKVVGD
jgi:predicted HTH domain antitoxin